MFRRKALRTAVMLVVLLAAPAAVHAQLFRAYLSASGSDANPCTIGAPCRLLPAALAAVADGGEIWMLNSANFNTATVNITKSVSILAIPGAVGSVVSTGGTDAININAGGVKVSLRNLAIVRAGVSNVGIKFSNGAELKVADCVISDMDQQGIAVFAPARVFIRDTVIRGSPTGFLASNGESTLDRVLVRANGDGIYATFMARVAVANSVVAGNTTGIVASAIVPGTVRVAIEKSVVADNQSGIRGSASGDSSNVEVSVSRSTVGHNSFVGIDATQFVGTATVTIVSDENLLAENGFGFHFTGTSTILSRGNNTLRFNGTDVSGGTLTALAAQ